MGVILALLGGFGELWAFFGYLGRRFGSLWRPLGAFGVPLGGFGGPLGSLWEVLGLLWAALGGFLVVFGRSVALFWAPWEGKTRKMLFFGVVRIPQVKPCISWVWAVKCRPKCNQRGPTGAKRREQRPKSDTGSQNVETERPGRSPKGPPRAENGAKGAT